MKQTVEEAAEQELISSYATIVKGKLSYQRQAMLNMFRKGAEWQAKQSPWISVEERYPLFEETTLNQRTPYLVRIVSGSAIQEVSYLLSRLSSRYKFACEIDWVKVTHWMPIPTFD